MDLEMLIACGVTMAATAVVMAIASGVCLLIRLAFGVGKQDEP